MPGFFLPFPQLCKYSLGHHQWYFAEGLLSPSHPVKCLSLIPRLHPKWLLCLLEVPALLWAPCAPCDQCSSSWCLLSVPSVYSLAIGSSYSLLPLGEGVTFSVGLKLASHTADTLKCSSNSPAKLINSFSSTSALAWNVNHFTPVGYFISQYCFH